MIQSDANTTISTIIRRSIAREKLHCFPPLHYLLSESNQETIMSSSQSLTQFLLSHASTSELHTRATQAPFLRLAGEGKLHKSALSRWLSQDRLYAQAYTRFIGGLISKVELPVILDRKQDEKPGSTIEYRILKLLSSALQGNLQNWSSS